MSPRTTGKLIGALFLAAFLCYGVGGLLVDSLAGSEDPLGAIDAHPLRLATGAVLMLGNSVVVAGIGVLAYGLLGDRRPRSAMAYLVARVFEATVLAIGVLFVLMLIPLGQEARDDTADALGRTLYAANDLAFQIAMIGLGLGSVLFCRVLLLERLVPEFMAWWGIVGYAVFATGAVLELFGVGVGVWLAIPGGLFEVTLGAMLLKRGFPEPGHVPSAPTRPAADATPSPAP